MDTLTLKQLVEVAETLIEDGDNKEYVRGVCELLGRAELDVLHQGDGTAENAVRHAAKILKTSEKAAYREMYGSVATASELRRILRGRKELAE